jgi:hypothetical protein
MNFGKRLRLYLTGVLFGCIIVYFLLIHKRNRNFTAWLPKQRILLDIKEKPFSDDPKSLCFIQCLNNDTTYIKNLLAKSDINFRNSLVNEKPFPIYILSSTLNDRKITFSIQITDKNLKIKDLSFDCNCD